MARRDGPLTVSLDMMNRLLLDRINRIFEYMRRILLSVVIFFISITASAQLEVKENSFKEVPGFVNINPDDNYQTDDNDLPFAVK